MSDDALILRTVDENDPLDNERGVTYRVKQETGTPDNKRGITYRVKNVGGGSATIDPLSITPSTSAQTITASGGTDGYSPVNVAAVDASIDANIVAGNIKKDVSILGVTGSYEGTTPTGTMYIISNGTYNVADKAIANVQVPTTAPAHYIEKTVDANGVLQNGSTVIDMTGVKSIVTYGLYYAYFNNTNLSGVVDFSDIENLNGNSLSFCFSGCTGITSFDMSSLLGVKDSASLNNCLSGCSGITSVKIDSFKYFYGSANLTRFLDQCSSLTDLKMPSINTSSFVNAGALNTMCRNIPNITIHFPSNVQTQVEALTGYSTTAPFGATSGTVLFDLPATVILTGANSVNYERNPKYDTATALAWRVQDTGTVPNIVVDWTPFYTSGTTDPQTSDTIYSDSACTTAVTTISSIA